MTVAVDSVDAAQREALRLGAIAAEATALTRDLANTPGQDLAPMDLARAARALARRGLRVRVHDRRALARLRMGAILGVGMGSAQPPCFIELSYRPPRARRRVALVGKGITFDSGGLSLKTADAMQAQKRDMAGAAVVLGVMSALPALRLPVEVRGYIASAENMPSGTGDPPRRRAPRLQRHDHRGPQHRRRGPPGARRRARPTRRAERPDCIIDFATLTAVVRTALGPRCAAVLGTDRRLIGELIASAADANEMLWELPLIEEYRRDIDSRVADSRTSARGTPAPSSRRCSCANSSPACPGRTSTSPAP